MGVVVTKKRDILVMTSIINHILITYRENFILLVYIV